METKPFTMYRWCGFHNLPMSICDHTSSMSCWWDLKEKSSFIHEILYDEDKKLVDNSEEKLKRLDKFLKENKINIMRSD